MNIAGLLIDIDGTVREAGRPIPGAAEALERLRGNVPLLFTTNTSRMPRGEVAVDLRQLGIGVREEEILTATTAASAWLLDRGIERVQLLVPETVLEDFPTIEVTEEQPEAVVVADLGAGFTFEVLNRAFRNLLDGARLVALHKNRFWLTEAGLALDAGPFVVALEYAARVRAELVGKPSPAFFELAASLLGVQAEGLAVVGDDAESDVAGARAAGLTAIQVRTGKYARPAPEGADPALEPHRVIGSIRDLPDLLAG